jgi:hypothetical protein
LILSSQFDGSCRSAIAQDIDRNQPGLFLEDDAVANDGPAIAGACARVSLI